MKPADRFEAVVASAPSNKTAALVTARGVHWEPLKQSRATWQDTPLPTLPYPKNAQNMIDPGTKIGRLTVIGYAGRRSDTAAYVVRCACDMYGFRRARSLRSNSLRQMCDQCDYLEELKAGRVPAFALDAKTAAAARCGGVVLSAATTDAQQGRGTPQPASDTPRTGTRHGPPAPTLGDVFAAAIRRRNGKAS